MNTFTTTSLTPRTDRAAEVRIVRCRPREIVDAGFARDLEKELDAALRQRDDLISEVRNFIKVSGRHNTVIAYIRLQKTLNQIMS